jgi:single-strand DNA-binding protein
MKGEENKVAKYSLAVDRKFKREGEATADFFNCTCFGKAAEFAYNYLHKGKKIAIVGELRNTEYTNKDGMKVHGVEIIVNEHEFCESKSAENGNTQTEPASEWVAPSGDEELPFT